MSKVTDKLQKLLERFNSMKIQEYEELYDASLKDIECFAGYERKSFYAEKENAINVSFQITFQESKVKSCFYLEKINENKKGYEDNEFPSDYIPAA